MKLEYNFIDFGTHGATTLSTSVPGGVVTPLRRDVDAEMQLVKLGINFRLN